MNAVLIVVLGPLLWAFLPSIWRSVRGAKYQRSNLHRAAQTAQRSGSWYGR